MKYANFKEHDIIRTCTERYDDYHKYKCYLVKDFRNRCCYCNISQETIMVSFHIDHFVPKSIKATLENEYNNLMLACPKCNFAKGKKYKGDVTNEEIENELFYNPTKVDFNKIFYRNELGGIDSDNPKGKEMIKLLKLFRPIYNLTWIVEKICELSDRIEKN